jgi:quercetin dioxygenase-like cupin family protein/GNAT superfamily N-acetyltransferase
MITNINNNNIQEIVKEDKLIIFLEKYYLYGEYINNKIINKNKAIKLKENEIVKSINSGQIINIKTEDKTIKGIMSFSRLDWDSNYFGFEVATLNYLYGEKEAKKELMDLFETWCKNNNIRLAYVRVANEDLTTIHLLEDHEFHYMENRIHFSIDLNKFIKKSILPVGVTFEKFTKEYKENTLRIINNSLPFSRFHREKITKNKANGIYFNWIKNTLEKDNKEKVILKVNNQFAGFYSYYKKEVKELGITSLWLDWAFIDPKYKGQGLGYHLYEYIVNKEKNNATIAEGKFSISNIPVFKIIKKLGAELIYSELTFHKIFGKQEEEIKMNEANENNETNIANENNKINITNETIYTSEKLKESLEKLKEESKLGVILQENPKMILINLPPDYKGEEEVHENEDDFYIVIDGKAELKVEEKNQTINTGDMIHIPAKKVHRLVYSEWGIKYLVVKIKKEKSEEENKNE